MTPAEKEIRSILAVGRPIWQQMTKGAPFGIEQAVPGFLQSVQMLFNQGYCLTDVGLMFGMTRERVRQHVRKHHLRRFVTSSPPRIWSWEQGMFIAIPATKSAYADIVRKRRTRMRHATWQERFWGNVAIGADDACWLWQGKRYQTGYGVAPRMPLQGRSSAPNYTHRLVYLFTHGALTPGLHVCHSCDNPGCCNPAHLWEGTAKENIQDSVRKGRWAATHQHTRRTHCKWGHELIPANVRIIGTKRMCKPCDRRRHREYYQRHRKEKAA